MFLPNRVNKRVCVCVNVFILKSRQGAKLARTVVSNTLE